MKSVPLVAVVLGSKSDQAVADSVTRELGKLGIPYEVKILSAHRTPKQLEEYVDSSNASVYIAIAGLAAHLPGFIASRTLKPVIGVPISAKLGGMDALLSIAQMPPGVPVATVGVDNGENAALLAARFLSLYDESVARALRDYKRG